jgi:hypothetical protein
VERAEKFWSAPLPPPLLPDPGDFNAASEEMDKSFQALRSLLDEVGGTLHKILTQVTILLLLIILFSALLILYSI